MSSDFNFLNFVGVEVEKSDKESAILFITLKEHHLQHLGYVHGGVISTIADNCGWFVLSPYLTAHQTAMTQELSINYLRPAKGKTLRCVGKMIKMGKKSAFVSAEVFCDDELVAFATSHLAVLEKRV